MRIDIESVVNWMKIWVIGRSYPEPSNNMMGTFEIEQAKMLQKNGEDVRYLCCSLHPTRVIKKRGYQCWKENGITVHSCSKCFFPRVYPLYFPKIRNIFWKNFLHKVYAEAGKPDIIHVHYPAMLMIADALREFHELGVKIVVTEHWSKVLTKSLDKIEQREYQKYFELIDACICVGGQLADVVKETIGNTEIPVFIVPNVVDPGFQPIYAKHHGFEFIAVGRLVKEKQFDKLIFCFSEVFRRQNVKLTIIGGGPEFNILKKIVSNLNIENQVILTGTLSRDEVIFRIARTNCLVCYSIWETFGVPVIEAWACGIPVIATPTMGIAEFLSSKLGILVHSNDNKELADAMAYLYNHIDEYDKDYISDFAKKMFSEETVSRQILSIYQK